MKETNIVALEIGSSKIKGAVGSIDDNGVLTVRVVDEEPLLDSVRYGVVSNAEEVANRASRLLDRLEDRSGNKTITGVYVALGSRSMRTDPRETERILPQEMEITADIIEQLMAEAAAATSPSRDQIDVVPREFIVDKTRVLKPIGTLGSSILMRSNIVSCRPQIKRNLCHLVNEKLSLDIFGFPVRQIAQADFVITHDEKRLGCMLVDCGAETTTVSIYKHGHLQYMQTMPLGSRNITRDLTHLNYLEEQAEEVKIHYGNAKAGAFSAEVNTNIDLATVNKFVAARAGEIIANIKEQVKQAGFMPKDLPSGIILVGRGARLAGFSERLADTVDLRVRLGTSVRTDVRLADPRISISDSVDVISTLYAASRHNPMECLEEPEPVYVPEPEPVRTVEPKEEPEPEPERKPAADQRPAKKTKQSWFRKVGDQLVKLVDENRVDDDDDDEGVMIEDKD